MTLKGYLLSEFSSNLNVHDECPFHCMTLLLSEKPSCSTPEEHNILCDVCVEQFKIFEDLKHEFDNCNNLQQHEKEKLSRKLICVRTIYRLTSCVG